MAATCPAGPKYTAALNEFGEFNTYKYYYEVGRIDDIDVMREYLKKELRIAEPLVHVKPLSKMLEEEIYQPQKMTEEVATAMMEFLNTKFPDLKSEVINDPTKKWKAHINISGRPVINIAHAEISDGFHEFSHPFLMTLRLTNRKLFKNIWKDLQNSPEWGEIKRRAEMRVAKLYPEYGGNAEKFAEEVLAHAIGYAAELQIRAKEEQVNRNAKMSFGFNNAIKNIFKWLNEFMTELFARRIKVSTLDETTTLGQVIDMFTDIRSRLILDNDWLYVDKILEKIQKETGGSIPNDLTQSFQLDVLAESARKDFDFNKYVEEWLEKTFKAPVREYKPRKETKEDLALRIAQNILANTVQAGFKFTGRSLRAKDKPSQKAIAQFANALQPIVFRYRFAEILETKGDNLIAINNLPTKGLNKREAAIVPEFQAFLKNEYLKDTGTKSLPANEMQEVFIDWVTENYGIGWVDSKGHQDFGIARITEGTNIIASQYSRIQLVDDMVFSNTHQFSMPGMGMGAGIGWYVRAIIQGDRFDHEFQSDILPEVAKSDLIGAYDVQEEDPEDLEKIIQQRAPNVHDLAMGKLSKMVTARGDKPLLNNMFQDVVTGRKNINDISEYEQKENLRYILTELEVSRKGVGAYSVGLRIAQQKSARRLLKIYMGPNNKVRKQVIAWLKTLEIEVIDKPLSDYYTQPSALPIAGVQDNVDNLPPPNFDDLLDGELPFSKEKLVDDGYKQIVMRYFDRRSRKTTTVYATAETINTVPQFVLDYIAKQNEWAGSTDKFKPYPVDNIPGEIGHIITEMDVFNTNGSMKNPFGQSRTSLLNRIEGFNIELDNTFSTYRKKKGRYKAYEWREQVYNNIENIARALEYYKVQYERLVNFYESVREESKAQARLGKVKQRKEVDARYKRYSNLYENWFDIKIHQSINHAKMEGRAYYYLPTAEAMELIEGNARARKLYIVPGEESVGRKTDEQLIQEYLEANAEDPRVASELRHFLDDIGMMVSEDTTTKQLAAILKRHHFKGHDAWVQEHADYEYNEIPGPFWLSLKKIAKKNNIKLSLEKPNWSKVKLIKVDLTSYEISHPMRFSKLDNYKDEAIRIIESVVGSIYENTPQNTPQWQVEMINRRLERMNNGGDVTWKFRLSSNGKYYLAGYKNAPVLMDNYYSPSTEWRRNSWMIEDEFTTEEQKDKQGSLREFDPPVEESKPDTKKLDEMHSAMIVDKLVRSLPEQLGVEMTIVTEEEAAELTKDTDAPYVPGSGQRAFFLGGQVYFVGNNLSTTMLLHEFSHPLVRAVMNQNRKLFDKLYDQLMTTAEGREIADYVAEKYTVKDENGDMVPMNRESDAFKEEVMVRALTAQAEYILNNKKTPSSFREVLKEIMYQIKQLLRKVFGQKVDVAKLDVNTKLSDLAEMLTKGDKFKIDFDMVNDADLAAYLIDTSEFVEDVMRISNKDLAALARTGYDVAIKQIDIVRKNRNFNEMRSVLVDELGFGYLYDVKGQFGKYTNKVDEDLIRVKGELELERSKAEAFVNGILRLENMTRKIESHLRELTQSDDINDKDNLQRAYYYNYLLRYWEEFILSVEDEMDRYDVDMDAPIVDKITKIKEIIARANNTTRKINHLGLTEILNDALLPVSKSLEEKYKTLIQHHKDKGRSQRIIDFAHKEFYGMTEAQWDEYNKLKKKGKNRTYDENKLYDRLHDMSFEGARITAEKISKTLKGDLGDSNFFNSWLEGYMYNTDPVVGGLALYVKNHITDVMNKSYRKYNTFVQEIVQDLRDIGYSPSRTSKLATQIAFADKVGRYNYENNTVEEVEVLTLLNPYKGYRFDIDKMNQEVEEAHRRWAETGLDEDEHAYNQARERRRQLRRDYFYQEYVQEFYQKDKLLVRDENDKIGIMAKTARDKILDQIEDLNSRAEDEKDAILIEAQINELWSQYRQLFSRFDLDNKLKTGDDLAIAERLTEYRNKTREYYEWIKRPGMFERALRAKEQEIIEEGHQPDTDGKYEEERARWIKNNTQIRLTQEFYDNKAAILEQISLIMQRVVGKMDRKTMDEFRELRRLKLEGNLEGKNEDRYNELIKLHEKETNYSLYWEDLLNIVHNYKDESGQVSGSLMSQDGIAEVKSLQEKIFNARKLLTKASGLSEAEHARLEELNEIDNTQGLTDDEYEELDQLTEKQSFGGLDRNTKKKLNSLYAQLAELQSAEATDDYCTVFNNWIEELGFNITKVAGRNSIDPSTADLMLRPNILIQLRKSPTFDDWFKRNHIRREKWDPKTKTKVKVWERIYVWNVSRPNDPAHFETETLSDGEVLVGVPTNKYWKRVVKEKYRTKRIVGETVDNKGNMLPRQFDPNNPMNDPKDGRYINEEYFKLKNADPNSEDGKIFKVLSKVSEYHLNNQEGLGRKSKLYLDVPRFRVNTLETVQGASISKIKGTAKRKFPLLQHVIENLKTLYKARKDDAESGFNLADDYNLVSTDMFDNELTNIHIAGLYDVEIDFVSKDILQSVNKYMLSAERQKKLIEINPTTQALQLNLKEHRRMSTSPVDKTSDGLKKRAKSDFLNRGVVTYLRKRGKSVRSNSVNAFIEREFENKLNADKLSDNRILNTAVSALSKGAAFSYFAFNATSAIKNWAGPKWQAMLETSAGKYMTLPSLARGQAYSLKAMQEMSFQTYKRAPKSKLLQIVDIFDAIQGRKEEKFGESLSRTLAHDIANMSWVYNFRKWTESEATLSIFFGMLEFQKVKRHGKSINYTSAWEVRDGQLELKDGIDVRYAAVPTEHTLNMVETYEDVANAYNIPLDEFEKIISRDDFRALQTELIVQEEKRRDELRNIPDTPENSALIERVNAKYNRIISEINIIKIDNIMFKTIQNRIHQATNDLQGAYSKFDQPEGQRYLMFRMMSYLRRYFTPMFVKRFGYSGSFFNPQGRMNPGLADNPLGYYMQAWRSVIRTFQVGPGYLMSMTKEEWRSWLRMVLEPGMLFAMCAIAFPLLGYDPDDEDRYKKLREKSGPLPLPGVEEQEGRPFDFKGYIELQLLNWFMQIRAENEALTPWPGMGMADYLNMLEMKFLAIGPTVRSLDKLFNQYKMYLEDDPKAWYERPEGPYEWQQPADKDEFGNPVGTKGLKYRNTFWKMLGRSGRDVDPAMYIQDQEQWRQTAYKWR